MVSTTYPWPPIDRVEPINLLQVPNAISHHHTMKAQYSYKYNKIAESYTNHFVHMIVIWEQKRRYNNVLFSGSRGGSASKNDLVEMRRYGDDIGKCAEGAVEIQPLVIEKDWREYWTCYYYHFLRIQ